MPTARVVEITPTREVKGLAQTLAIVSMSYQQYKSLQACATQCSDTTAQPEEKAALRRLECRGLVRRIPFNRWALTEKGENFLAFIALNIEQYLGRTEVENICQVVPFA